MAKRGRPVQEEISPAQEAVLRELEACLATGRPPTIRELADRLGHGVSTVYKSVRHLERKGYIGRVDGKSRSLTVLRPSDRPKLAQLVSIPLLGTVAAGSPIFSPENHLGVLSVDNSSLGNGRHFALKVSGRSMIDAGINSGDVVIVRQQPLAEHRDIVVALLNDEATVKRLNYRDGAVSLLPANPKFKPIPVGPDDDLRIVGKVVAVRSESK